MSILDIGLAARVVAGIRTHTAQRTGCREWDATGIANALRAMTGPPGACLAAACLAAEDANLDKPSAAGFMICYPTAQAVEPLTTRPLICPTHRIQHSPMDRCPSCAGDEKAHAEEFEPPTEPMGERTPPPDLSELRQRLRETQAQQRSKVEAMRAGGAS